MNKTMIGAALAATAAITAGCGSAAQQATLAGSPTAATPSVTQPTEPEGSASSPATTDPSATATTGQNGQEALKQAGQAALKAVPNSTLISMETEENGKLWEVQVVDADGTEHQMDVQNGKVVSGPTTEDEDDQDKAKHKDRVAKAKIDYAQAADKIAAAVPEGHITELNLDTTQGKTVWESDVVTEDGVKHEVTLDAATGAVMKNTASSSPSPTTSPTTSLSPSSSAS